MNGTDNCEQRESEVLGFISNLNKQADDQRQMNAFNNSTEMKLKKLNNECDKAPSVCLDTILGRIYKDALPFKDPQKNCSDDTARGIMHDFIAKRTGGKNSEYYVREAIKKTNSPTLKNLLNESKALIKEFYSEKAKDIGVINIDDLDFKASLTQDKIDKLTKKMDLDEVADIIKKNVQSTLKEEADRAKREEEYRQKIEDKLANDTNVTDQASMESAIEKINTFSNHPKVYQPSLFESILLGKAKSVTESASNTTMLIEAVHEFTKLNIAKSLRLESFDLRKLKGMSDTYLAG